MWKSVGELSFLNKFQKECYEHYSISSNGKVMNDNRGSEVKKVKHGTRGYAVNFSKHVDGRKNQRFIMMGMAVADLFIRPMKKGEKIVYIDGDEKNLNYKNLKYEKEKSNE